MYTPNPYIHIEDSRVLGRISGLGPRGYKVQGFEITFRFSGVLLISSSIHM